MDNATDWHEEQNAEIVGLASGILCAGGWTLGGDNGQHYWSCCIGTITQTNRQLMVVWLITEHQQSLSEGGPSLQPLTQKFRRIGWIMRSLLMYNISEWAFQFPRFHLFLWFFMVFSVSRDWKPRNPETYSSSPNAHRFLPSGLRAYSMVSWVIEVSLSFLGF